LLFAIRHSQQLQIHLFRQRPFFCLPVALQGISVFFSGPVRLREALSTALINIRGIHEFSRNNNLFHSFVYYHLMVVRQKSLHISVSKRFTSTGLSLCNNVSVLVTAWKQMVYLSL
jgi:hypothetical protein